MHSRTDPAYVIGFDYGTNSCRAVLMRPDAPAELALATYAYPSGKDGVLYDPRHVHLARQRPSDYLAGVQACVSSLLEQARRTIVGFDASQVRGLGFAATGSTVIPVDADLHPLADRPEFSENLDAMSWLWKDHTSEADAERLTQAFRDRRPEMIARCGGVYSPEWFWAKVLRLSHSDPHVFGQAAGFVELCEFLPGTLSGAKANDVVRSACAQGHKLLHNSDWGGLPDAGFLGQVDPVLVKVRESTNTRVETGDRSVGTLTSTHAAWLGLSPDVAIAGGAFDAHFGAVGAGIGPGKLVKVMGTSTCDIMISSADAKISGICGVFRDTVLPGFFGIEAGQSAVGDLFKWLVQQLVPDRYGTTDEEKFANLSSVAEQLLPGESGLVALDWNNGNRSVLVDMDINGLVVGQTLHTTAAEIFRALIEATAFGSLLIIEQIEGAGVAVDEIVCCGGLAQKNPFVMQIYADVTARPIVVADSHETCAKGAAIFAAAAAGLGSVVELQRRMVSLPQSKYRPNAAATEVYRRLYEVYLTLHDAFGRRGNADVYHVMKTLNAIRREASRG
ncbi:hypothetical protein ASC97_26890 [Rhizobium sp. Root1203]|uniref:ribulokinase n=1 Tax=Rhizobium sp. Root1203 TaxID=1736427 RepID=UPI00070D7B1E|nr:ribulokinase [Rhizobium sp. Root1203]KQV23631.1 hypothetical protein ASC97_26890 [Rhizobium sp. Root1203]